MQCIHRLSWKLIILQEIFSFQIVFDTVQETKKKYELRYNIQNKWHCAQVKLDKMYSAQWATIAIYLQIVLQFSAD